MKSHTLTAMAVGAPSFGPAVVTLFGIDIPLVSMGVSFCGVLLARTLAPPPLRKLNWYQHITLTLLLLLLMFLLVTELSLGPGAAVGMGIGLGFSGLVVVEMVADKALSWLNLILDRTGAALKVLLGGSSGDGNTE